MSSVWKSIRRQFAAFRAARGGNVAVMFALAIIPIIAAVGFAVDYTRANSVKTAMQDALDSTALMLSRNVSSLSQDDLQTQANAFFKALFNRPEAANIVITASYTTDGGTSLTVNGSADVPTTFLNVLGYKQMTVDGTSTTRWGSSRLRVALVLDNTGSMAQSGKIDALKTATKNLLTQLQNAVSTPGDVYVSIIPFVKDVSVDPTNYDSSWDNWIRWDDGTDNSWDGANGTCSVGNKSPRSTCTAQSYLLACRATTARAAAPAQGHALSLATPAKAAARTRALARFPATIARTAATSAGIARFPATRRKAVHERGQMFEVVLHDAKQVHAERICVDDGRMDQWRVDRGGLDAGCMDPGDLDTQKPQHLERLLHRPWHVDRPRHVSRLRPGRDRADFEHSGDAVPGRAIRLLPESDDGPQLRLDGHEVFGRKHVG